MRGVDGMMVVHGRRQCRLGEGVVKV
jgi:hypothetical protein